MYVRSKVSAQSHNTDSLVGKRRPKQIAQRPGSLIFQRHLQFVFSSQHTFVTDMKSIQMKRRNLQLDVEDDDENGAGGDAVQ